MLSKTQRHFQVMDLTRWCYHHFASGHECMFDEQIGVTTEIISKTQNMSTSPCGDVWLDIIQVLSRLEWPVDPEKLTRDQWEDGGTDFWFPHFYDSHEWDIGVIFENNRYQFDSDYAGWLLLVKENNRAEEEWVNSLQARREWRCRTN